MNEEPLREFTARAATAEEIADWDRHVTANPNGGNLLQSAPFADVKSQHGWTPRHLVYETADYSSYNLVLEKDFPILGKLWYLIKGPDVADASDIPGILQANRKFVRDHRQDVFAIKIEPDLLDGEEVREAFARAGLVKTFNIQPNDSTAVLDVTPEENKLLRNLHSRGRNAIRRAIREGVEVVQAEPTEENFRTMYRLMDQVGQGNAKVQLRSFEYYSRFWRNFIDAGIGRLYFVYEDGAPSVGAFVINYGRKGTYKDGGSKPRRSQYGDSHLVQWRAINDLKELGIESYDFCGTPPAAKLKDKDHAFHGLGMFKTSFTKTVIDYVGCYDQVISPLKYKLWETVGEKVFRQLYWRKHHQPFY